jgi:hypothetical protein
MTLREQAIREFEDFVKYEAAVWKNATTLTAFVREVIEGPSHKKHDKRIN